MSDAAVGGTQSVNAVLSFSSVFKMNPQIGDPVEYEVQEAQLEGRSHYIHQKRLGAVAVLTLSLCGNKTRLEDMEEVGASRH